MTDKYCRICGCREKKELFNLSSGLKLMGGHFPDSPSVITECPNCGLVYVDTEANQNDFNKYYSSPNSNPFGYYELYGEKNTNKYFSDILSRFNDKITEHSEILDFAGGSGDFVKFLIEKGYKNAKNLEISEKCKEIALKKGVDTILVDGSGDVSSYENQYDLITMIHSLEHFCDIDKVISNSKKMLKNNGFLYIEIPDASKYSDTNSVPYTMFTYEHLYHFTLHTLENIGNAFGLKLVKKGQFFKAESYDVIYALYQNEGVKGTVQYNSDCAISVINYNENSAKRLRPFIKMYEETQEPIILWGIGASTALLLNKTFDKCNILQLIDRNKTRQGLKYKIGNKDYFVEDPSCITDKKATIVVLPYWYNESIRRQIQEMGLKNPVKGLM